MIQSGHADNVVDQVDPRTQGAWHRRTPEYSGMAQCSCRSRCNVPIHKWLPFYVLETSEPCTFSFTYPVSFRSVQSQVGLSNPLFCLSIANGDRNSPDNWTLRGSQSDRVDPSGISHDSQACASFRQSISTDTFLWLESCITPRFLDFSRQAEP